MSTSVQRLQRLLRAYPSLKLNIDVDQYQHEAFVNLPGLRYDDIDYTGQPSAYRLLNAVKRAEHAAFHNSVSYLMYTKLHNHGIGTFCSQMIMEFGRHYYDVTVPKCPMNVKLNLIGIAESSFTTCMSVMVGGRSKPSVQVKSLNVLHQRETGLQESVPAWWRSHFLPSLPSRSEKLSVSSRRKDDISTFSHHVCVPYGDTDTTGNTQHSSYFHYVFDNISIASHRAFYRQLTGQIDDFLVHKLSLISYSHSQYGDSLTVETFENPSNNNYSIHSYIGKDGFIIWYGCVEFFPPYKPT